MNNLWLIFLTGLTTGGISCAAVQGGLLTSALTSKSNQKSVTLFLVAKLISHTLLGFLLGWLGTKLELSTNVRLVFQALAALFMLATAANLLKLHPIFRYFVLQPPRWVRKFLKNSTKDASLFTPFILGFFTILIPCGVTQSMEVVAITAGSAWLGAAIMFAFVLGTSPVFAAIGMATVKLSEKFQEKFLKVAAGLLIILAASSLNGVLVVMDAPITLQKITSPISYFFSDERFDYAMKQTGTNPVTNQPTTQQVTINVGNSGYSPNYIKVKAGQPVQLTLNADKSYSCANSFVLKAFNIQVQLAPTDSKFVTFTPTTPGKYTFSCSMGMYTGILEVI